VQVTTCLVNLEMSGNLTAVRDFTKSQGKNLSGKSCLKLLIVNCIFVSIQVFNIKYVVWIMHCCIPTATTDSSTGII